MSGQILVVRIAKPYRVSNPVSANVATLKAGRESLHECIFEKLLIGKGNENT